MNMPWMVPVLLASLIVVVASFAAAVTADAATRRSPHRHRERSASADPKPVSSVRTLDENNDTRSWSRIAMRAWVVCAAASLLSVALIGMLILFA